MTETVRLEDLFPTLLELLDIPVPLGLDGESFVGETRSRIARAVLGGNQVAMITRQFPEFDASRLELLLPESRRWLSDRARGGREAGPSPVALPGARP